MPSQSVKAPWGGPGRPVVTKLSQGVRNTATCAGTCRYLRCTSVTLRGRSNSGGNVVLRTVNPSANAYAGSNPAPATAARVGYLAVLAVDQARANASHPS